MNVCSIYSPISINQRNIGTHCNTLRHGPPQLRGISIPSHRVPTWAQMMHFPEEEFLDAEADDVTVCDSIERNAEPQAFLILVNPVTWQASDVDHILGGVKNPITAFRPSPEHLLDGVFACRGGGFGQRAARRSRMATALRWTCPGGSPAHR